MERSSFNFGEIKVVRASARFGSSRYLSQRDSEALRATGATRVAALSRTSRLVFRRTRRGCRDLCVERGAENVRLEIALWYTRVS